MRGPLTLRPGTWAYHAAKHWECWAPTPAAAPLGPRNTIGQEICPADMYSVFAAELMIWSMACMAKLKVINSHTGLTPAKAAPTAIPVKPACRDGQVVSISSCCGLGAVPSAAWVYLCDRSIPHSVCSILLKQVPGHLHHSLRLNLYHMFTSCRACEGCPA
jgi:hypothetical protein